MLFPLLAACAADAPTWQKTGASESAINEDLQQCRVQARLSPDPSILATPAVQNSGTPMIDRGQERDAKEDQQVRACMQAKGYSLTKR
jgi:hypothetical protein